MRERWHVLVGSTAEREYLDKVEERVAWYVPKGCRPGDGVIFLAPSFEGDFMAVGRIATAPVRDEARAGYFVSEVEDFRRLSRPISVAEARRCLAEWKYLSYARSYTTIPDDIQPKLLEMLDLGPAKEPVQKLGSVGPAKEALTLFSWGYEGWGNWTEQLVRSVDAVEAARGWGPPLFVDVRASRSVRAVGFRDRAFQERFGPNRYRWIKGLGNAAIIEQGTGLIDPARAADLLELALELMAERRRVIFFCHCVSPTSGCHRHWITPELLALAQTGDQELAVVEWPGFESDSGLLDSVQVKATQARGLGNQRKSLPLGPDLPTVEQLARPWFTPVKVMTGETLHGYVLTGPAQHRSGEWMLPMLSSMVSWPMALKLQRYRRSTEIAGPSGHSVQVPFTWDWGTTLKSEVSLCEGDSLEKALEDLADGGLVRLGPGVFRVADLQLLQPLRLQGSGPDATVIASSSGYSVLWMEGDDSWEIQNLTVRHEGDVPACCILAMGGELRVTHCRFEGAVSSEEGALGSGLLASGTNVSVLDCETVGCDCGIELGGEAIGTVARNLCREGEIGILVHGDASPMVESNQCRSNDVGILYRGSAGGVCCWNECSDCQENGIQMDEDAAPSLQENRVETAVAGIGGQTHER